jgi:DNA primase small subunit
MLGSKQFYFKYFPLYPIYDIPRREFGFHFDKKIIRHLQFTSMGELTAYVVKFNPTDIYCSASFYTYPSEKNMDKKEWFGSELIFDIDGKDLGMDCINRNDLSVVKKEVKKLIKILEKDFNSKQIQIYFSGNNGFHIHVLDEKYYSLNASDRRDIANYILSKDVKIDAAVTMDIHRIFRMIGSINNKSGNVKVLIPDIDKFKIKDCSFSN